ncbi:MAG: ABC transporter permease [Thermoanaerobaculia bacterium]
MEELNVPAFLAKRFLLGSRRGLPKAVSLLALFGVALGAASLVVAMGLMSGYRHDLAEKLAGTSAEVIAMPEPDGNVEEQRARLRALANVAAVARTAFAPALLLSSRAPEGVDALVKALELPDGLATTPLLGAVPDLAKAFRDLESRGTTPVLLGAGLAKRLGVSTGGTIVLETASTALAAGLAAPARTPLVIAGVVETGFSEVDDGWALVSMAVFEALAPPGARQGVWEMKLLRPSASAETVAAARKLLGEGATVLDWKVLNRDLFEALAVQQTLLFIVLTLIVAVAAGTVVSSLVVLLAEKTRDVGVLAALGAPPALVARAFRLSGVLLGGAGLVLGVLFGLLVCFLLTAFRVVRFPPEIAKVYYLTWMPFRPEPLHLLGILGIGLLLVLVASLFPARRASRMNPSEALRYE